MAIAVAEAAVAAGLRIVLLPAAYHRAGWNAPAHAGPAPLLRPGRRDATSPASTRCAAWASGRAGRRRRRRGAQRPRGARRPGWRRSPPTPTGTASSGTCTRTSSRASSRSAARSTASRRSSCSHRTGFLGPRTSLIHGIHVTEADVGRLAASDTIVVSCPTTEGSLGDGHFPALVYRDAGVRIAIGSDSNVRVDPFEETRELETLARRERRTRHALLATYGDLWGELRRERPREPRPARGRHRADRPRPSGPRGRRGRRPPARGRDVRVGRGRRYASRSVRNACSAAFSVSASASR